MKIFKFLFLLFITLFLFLFSIYKLSNVDVSIQEKEKEYLKKLHDGSFLNNSDSMFLDQIFTIKEIQSKVIDIIKHEKPIPKNSERNIKTIFEMKGGECYDRSLVIEKLLRNTGFKVRHVFILLSSEKSKLHNLLTKGVSSHAVTEVLTSKGWLVVDSNKKWISLNNKGEPISINQIQKNNQKGISNFKSMPETKIFTQGFEYYYGLHSRHGKFFAPYNFLPDIDYSDFLYNF
tara:strand:- start:2339 stop:3037 length:699 start_codon:yes stop_codon:yes gene_type:complete